MTLKRWLPLALVLIAFAMRTAWLAQVPPGLHHDEVIYTSIAEKALGGSGSSSSRRTTRLPCRLLPGSSRAGDAQSERRRAVMPWFCSSRGSRARRLLR